jgi:hypothetical protein
MLAELAHKDENDDLGEEEKVFHEKLVAKIQEFNRNCKKRKTKKI